MKEFDLGPLPSEPIRTKEDLVVSLIMNPPDIIGDATHPLQDRRKWGDEDPLFTFQAVSQRITHMALPFFNPDVTKKLDPAPHRVTQIDLTPILGREYKRDTTKFFSEGIHIGTDTIYFPPDDFDNTTFAPTRTVGLYAFVERENEMIFLGVETTKFWRELDDENINVYKISEQKVSLSQNEKDDSSVRVVVGPPDWGSYTMQKLTRSFNLPQADW